MTPEGIRNGNPMNIVYSDANKWDFQTAPAGRFCTFLNVDGSPNPIGGIRAGVVNLKAYRDRHGCVTLTDFISKWAPHAENNVIAYVNDVSKRSGIGPNDPFDPGQYDQCAAVVKAMIWHENGDMPYTDAQIDRALALAGVAPAAPASLLASSRTVKGSGVALTGGSIIAASGILQQIEPAIPAVKALAELIHSYPGVILGVVGLAVVIGAGYAIWARIDDHRRLAR